MLSAHPAHSVVQGQQHWPRWKLSEMQMPGPNPGELGPTYTEATGLKRAVWMEVTGILSWGHLSTVTCQEFPKLSALMPTSGPTSTSANMQQQQP